MDKFFLKIYAPCDGFVKPITEIKDGAFKTKQLGDGIFIVPETDEFYSPLEKCEIALIAATKHAIYFSKDEVNVLMHIGLDTVKLAGKPFEVFTKVGQTVQKNDLLVKLKRSELDEINLETPILVDVSNFKSYKLNYVNINKHVKTGDLLYEVEYQINTSKSAETTDLVVMKQEINKYQDIAKKILQYIGGVDNQTDVFNCMTRLRFKILDKSKVDIKNIEALKIVKGTNWNGEQLQVIIGGEVYKVKDETVKLIQNNGEIDFSTKLQGTKKPFRQKLAPAISSILFPTIPVLIGAGIIGALQSILVLSGLLRNPSATEPLQSLDMWSALFFIASKVGLELIGVVFLYSTVKYLKGDIPLALGLALMLTSHYFIGDGWKLFTLFGNEIAIKTYEGTVLPMIAAGFLVHYLNEWTKNECLHQLMLSLELLLFL
ncbi:beta-glucoside PTS system IIABC component [Spiroplasma clarkii]|uniref:PTS glucose transporter subunit IIA n=1 Tax=Spiroplasma clarkii TaxID=2139 RepID=UPI000B58137B|nr:PTS glucose transporter subunit IIABC [Spiroplasma clarkii]ARU91505.1 beta-glucoside PTS system IIABC component [Spiroplasma clarkii]